MSKNSGRNQTLGSISIHTRSSSGVRTTSSGRIPRWPSTGGSNSVNSVLAGRVTSIGAPSWRSVGVQLGGQLVDDPLLSFPVELAQLVLQGRLVDVLVPPVDRLGAEQRPAADHLAGDLVGGRHHPARLGVAHQPLDLGAAG